MIPMRRLLAPALTLGALVACGGDGGLETRTFELKYLPSHQVAELIDPYVYRDREGDPGRVSVTESAVTVRERPDNLDRIARVLDQYDRPRPTVMLHFRIIRADGAAGSDPAIGDVERELRRLFRFEGYQTVAEATIGGIAGTTIRQVVGSGDDQFAIYGGVNEVRSAADPATVSLDVQLSGIDTGPILETGVVVAEGQSVVLGTAQKPGGQGALILVVRADVEDASTAVEGGAAPDEDGRG